MPSLTSLVRLVLPRRCVACAAPGEWMCERLRPAPARARGPAVRALRRPDGAGRHVLPRLQPAALAHDRALRAVAGRPRARTRRALEARRDLTRAAGRRAHGPRAAAAPGRGDRRRARRARPAAAARRRPAGGARARARRAGGSVPVVPLLRRTRGVRPQRGLDATARRAQRARRLRRPRRPARPGARRRRLHDRRDRRRMRPRAAPGGRRAGARRDARAHAPRSDLCARAAPWQTPGTDVPERGGTRCSFRSAAGTWISRSRSASTPNASSRGSSAT